MAQNRSTRLAKIFFKEAPPLPKFQGRAKSIEAEQALSDLQTKTEGTIECRDFKWTWWFAGKHSMTCLFCGSKNIFWREPVTK